MTTNSFIKSNSIGFNNSIKNDFSIFPKEFVNRIDEIITFNDASIGDIKIIINKKIEEYNIKYNKNIVLSKEEIENIINKSDYINFGYRKINRLIKKELDNKIMETI